MTRTTLPSVQTHPALYFLGSHVSSIEDSPLAPLLLVNLIKGDVVQKNPGEMIKYRK